jgi:hypothetical protein
MLERKSDRIEMITPSGAKVTPLYDLSKTGVSCLHSEPKVKNNFVMVKINDIVLKAKVVYCQKREKDYRLGLQFWNVLPERQEKLNTIVESYSRGVPVSCSIVEETDNSKEK